MRKWRWIGHTLSKGEESIEKKALERNPQGNGRRGRLKQTHRRTILEEAGKCNKTWSEVQRLAGNRVKRRSMKNALRL
jgi:hypothetical protein